MRVKSRTVIVMYVSNRKNLNSCVMFIKSIRRFSGSMQDTPVVVVHESSSELDLSSLILPGVETCLMTIRPEHRDFFYSLKVHACAAAEKLLSGQTETMLYFDSEMLALSSFEEMHLKDNFDVSFRPVMLLNSVGLLPEQTLDGYWKQIFSELGVNGKSIPTVRAYVDEKEIRFYINCEAIVVRPELEIFNKWKNAFVKILDNREFIRQFCSDQLHAIFLHQAVLSATILSEVKQSRIQWMADKTVYSLLLHDKMPVEKKISRACDVPLISYDMRFSGSIEIVNRIPMDEPWFSWVKSCLNSFARVDANY